MVQFLFCIPAFLSFIEFQSALFPMLFLFSGKSQPDVSDKSCSKKKGKEHRFCSPGAFVSDTHLGKV